MKKIVITGGSNGIGCQCVKKFLENGYSVFVLDIDNNKFEKEKNVIFFKCDVGNYTAVLKCSRIIQEKFGSIDALVNCAGIQIVSSFEKYNYDEWSKVFRTNFFGVCNTIHSFMNNMNNPATILNIISVHSSVPRTQKYAYDCSKSAIEMLTKELALEFASKNITINSLAFGAVNTNMNKDLTLKEIEIAREKVPMKIIFEPEIIANFIFEIIENFANYTTGSTFVIDGGRSLT